jgi:hypothetical protein
LRPDEQGKQQRHPFFIKDKTGKGSGVAGNHEFIGLE